MLRHLGVNADGLGLTVGVNDASLMPTITGS